MHVCGCACKWFWIKKNLFQEIYIYNAQLILQTCFLLFNIFGLEKKGKSTSYNYSKFVKFWRDGWIINLWAPSMFHTIPLFFQLARWCHLFFPLLTPDTWPADHVHPAAHTTPFTNMNTLNIPLGLTRCRSSYTSSTIPSMFVIFRFRFRFYS